MDFTIFSLGDAAFLHAVLNAVSSIPQQTYMTLGGIGAILGLIIMATKGANEGNLMKAGFQGLAISGIVFYIMFIPRVDRVVVKDMNPPPAAPPMYVVDNVPAGFAAVGSVTSTIGVFLARTFDTTFGDVDANRVMNGGVGDNLRRIAMLRHLSDDVWLSANAGPNMDIARQNMAAYMSQCTMTGMTTGELRSGVLSPTVDNNADGRIDAIDGMFYEHQAVQTRLNVNGEWRTFSCRDGIRHILPPNQSEMVAEFEEAASRGSPNAGGQIDIIDTLEAFNVPQAGTWVQSAIVNQMAAAASRQAAMNGGGTQGGMMGAMMVEEAAARRNIQFAGEQNMFLRTIRTTIGFFEAVFYALGPIMAILVMTGPMGLTIASKYLLLTIWVLLWYPMIAIINMYGNTKWASIVAELASRGDYISTPMGTHHMLVTAQDQLGSIAGLIAATPVLAMSLIYGGAVAMNAVASRLTGGDQINEGMVAPQGVSVGSASEISPQAQASIGSGVQGGGTRDVSIAGSTSAQKALSFSKQDAVSDAQALMRSWGQAAEYSRSVQSGSTQGGGSEGLSGAMDRVFTQSLNGLASQDRSVSEALNVLKQTGSSLQFYVAADGTVSVGTPGGSLSPVSGKFSASTGVENSTTETAQMAQVRNAIDTINRAVRSEEGVSLRFAEQVAKYTQDVTSYQTGETTARSDSLTNALVESATSTRQSIETATKLDTLMNDSAVKESATMQNVVQTMKSTGSWGENTRRYEDFLTETGTRDQYYDALAYYNRIPGYTPEQAQYMAYMRAAEGAGDGESGNKFRVAMTKDALMVQTAQHGPDVNEVSRLGTQIVAGAEEARPSTVRGTSDFGVATQQADVVRQDNTYTMKRNAAAALGGGAVVKDSTNPEQHGSSAHLDGAKAVVENSYNPVGAAEVFHAPLKGDPALRGQSPIPAPAGQELSAPQPFKVDFVDLKDQFNSLPTPPPKSGT